MFHYRIPVAELLLSHALLVRDAGAARAALNVIFDEIRISDREGIRSDWCFHQHGCQSQFGNYGLAFLALQSRLAELCAGTELAMPASKFEMLCNLAEDKAKNVLASTISGQGRSPQSKK